MKRIVTRLAFKKVLYEKINNTFSFLLLLILFCYSLSLLRSFNCSRISYLLSVVSLSRSSNSGRINYLLVFHTSGSLLDLSHEGWAEEGADCGSGEGCGRDGRDEMEKPE